MRRIIPTALVAVSLVTLTAVGVTAQDEPAAVAITPAALNADKVDGKSAVGHGASARKRAGKLVATNKRGQLPSNIVKPAWRLILGKPAAFVDGQISWGEVQDKPGAFADGQIGWGEVQNKPAPPKITLTKHATSNTASGTGIKTVDLSCPTGKLTGGGFGDVNGQHDNFLIDSYPLNATTWRVKVDINTPSDYFDVYVICMTAEPATLVARLTPAARNRKSDR